MLVVDEITWSELPRGRHAKQLVAAARGLLVAVPLLLVFGALFAAADAVFSDLSPTRRRTWQRRSNTASRSCSSRGSPPGCSASTRPIERSWRRRSHPSGADSARRRSPSSPSTPSTRTASSRASTSIARRTGGPSTWPIWAGSATTQRRPSSLGCRSCAFGPAGHSPHRSRTASSRGPASRPTGDHGISLARAASVVREHELELLAVPGARRAC